ncbi:hypothetical protein FJZ31_24875 [Candidatus Poribacteria bacterium]|nr:hypothetical protein [Candidatus Poribacteria bacterium]
MKEPQKAEIWTELLKMNPVRVKLEQLYLDPNNPRLEISGKEKIADNRIVESYVQADCINKIREKGIDDLIGSIKSYGFWTVDRVVLRPLGDDKYVVVEGNRRVATLKILADQHKRGQSLPEDIRKEIFEFEAMVYKGTDPNIAWVVQSFRHIPGIKGWDDYPKAKFIANFEKESGKSPTEIASMFGMKPRAEVSRLIRSYYGFEQAKKDEDYGEDLKPEKFGMFYNVVFGKPEIRNWLGWDDEQKEFKNVDNFVKFVSWIVPDEDEEPKIDISPNTRDTLAKLVQPEHKELFGKFEEGRLSIDECKEKIFGEEIKMSVDISDDIHSLEKMKGIITKLPIPKMQLAQEEQEIEQKNQIVKLLEDLFNLIKQQLKNLGV